MIELCCEYLSVRCIWLYVIIMSRTSFRVNLKSTVFLNVKEFLARSRRHIWGLTDSKGTQNHNHLVDKWTQNHLATLAIDLCCENWYVWYIWLHVIIISRASLSKSTLYSLPEYQGTPYLKQAPYLRFKWLQQS